jgi:hypothetical protein
MPSTTELQQEIAVELGALRRGKGMQAPDLGPRLGPLLRELIPGTERLGTHEIRECVESELTRMAQSLPPDLHTALMAAFALDPATRGLRFLDERMVWLARQLERDVRTARRRADEAVRLLAGEIASELLRHRDPAIAALDGWYLREFRTLLRLDSPEPEAIEIRRIVTTRPGLERIIVRLEMPIRPDGPNQMLEAELLYGGQILSANYLSRRSLQVQVQLPRPLQPGEEHEYALRLRFPVGIALPYIIFRPERRCDLFDLRVRFDPANLPVWIRQVDGETQSTFEDATPPYDHLIPDKAGEIQLRFHYLRENRNYGMQWAQGLPAT